MISEVDREKIAARWLIEQDDPTFSDDQRDELARWLVQSVENCRAYLRLVRAWRKVALLRRTQTPIMYGPTSGSTARVSALLAPRSRRKRKGVEAFDLRLINKSFGAVLRANRLEQGLTQERLAAKSGVNRSYLSRIEAGSVSPTLTVVFRLSDALKIAPSVLISCSERAELDGPHRSAPQPARPAGVPRKARS
jgi:ribosome-binding protein aMBF1 (putative translation factor)